MVSVGWAEGGSRKNREYLKVTGPTDFNIDSLFEFTQKGETRKIEARHKQDFLELTVYPKDQKPVIYRVWPCGRIEKMEWKELSPNAENTIRWNGIYQINPSNSLTLENRLVQ